MGVLHSLSVGKSHRDAVLCGDFVNTGFVRANEVACAARVYNGSAVSGIEELLVVGKQIAILFVSLPLSAAPIPYCCRIRLRVGA